MENSVKFLKKVLREIKKQDSLHAKTLKVIMSKGRDFDNLRDIIYNYFSKRKVSVTVIVRDYLHMIADMRRETMYFMMNGSYSCKNEQDAHDKVYSNDKVMSYYMNALVISQLLWNHHFRMFEYFKETLFSFGLNNSGIRILDIGAGHGIYSYITRECLPVCGIDILDISESSLRMTEMMIGRHLATYIQSDIKDYFPDLRYDLIIMGEVLEHLDDPFSILLHVRGMLKEKGILWITVPTNAPTIDHVYLFRTKDEVINLIKNAGFGILAHFDCQADYLTSLIGIFCVKK
jgi:2-polyprenyl-3-methyl-5-hydroxy-6-metoxy-1,4-benzoquinol methylase